MDSKSVDIKISQLILYIAQKIDDLYVTKLLKLLYIIDEQAIKETGEPVTWLEYNVWKLGPVNPELHTELAYNSGSKLKDKIQIIPNMYGQVVIPQEGVAFDDGEFSDYEIKLIDRMLVNYGKLSSKELVDILHCNGTLWYKIVKENDLEEKFKYEGNNTSQFKINFGELLNEDPLKKSIYKSAKESFSIMNQIDCICGV